MSSTLGQAAMAHFPERPLRRDAVLPILCALPILFFLGCASTHIPSPQINQQIRTIGDAFGSVRAEAPDLPGLTDYDAIAANAFSERNDEDANLLIGRLYFDATQKLSRSRTYASSPADVRESVRRALSQHRPIQRFSRAHFDQLLADTKARAENDGQFRCAVAESAQLARYTWNNAWDDYRCIIDGIPWPIIACRTLVLNDMVETLF